MTSDRFITNRNQDGDLLIGVNVGGTPTTALTIDGATGAATFAGNLTVSGLLSAGSVKAGDKNYTASGASSTTGWVDAGTGVTISTSTTASELPEAYWAASGLKVLNEGSGTSHARYRFTLDAGDLSKKLSLSCYLESSSSPAYVAGDYKFEIFETTDSSYATGLTALTLQTSNIPALSSGGFFNTTFDSSTKQFLELRITRVAGALNSFVVFSSIKIGPGEIVQGAAISEWQSYTPIVVSGWSGGTLGGRYRRVGSSMDIEISIVSPTTWSGNVEVRIPTGFTVDTNAIPAASPGERFPVGQAVFVDDSASTRYLGTVVYYTTTSVRIWSTGGADVWAPVAGRPVAGQNGADAIHLIFSVPIAEWAGSGTVNLGAGAQVEYAFNTSTATTGDDTTSFAYGPNGVQFYGITAAGRRRVRFQYPIQADDLIVLEVSKDSGVTWGPVGSQGGASDFVVETQRQGTVLYGFTWDRVAGSTTDIDVEFESTRCPGGTSSYAAAGGPWSDLASSTNRWRVRKAKASSPVGFGLAGTDGSSGLYQAGRAPGLTTGAAIASGYIGERVTWITPPASQLFGTTEADWTNAQIQLTAGTWLVIANISVEIQCGSTSGNWSQNRVRITDTSNNIVQNMQKSISVSCQNTGVAPFNRGVLAYSFVANLNSSQTYKIRAARIDGIGTGTSAYLVNSGDQFSEFFAIRIA